jgi:cytochrome P450
VRNADSRRLAWAEMRLILARIVFEFDMKLAEDGHNWIERQKTFPLWDRQPLNVYFTPVERD